MRIRLQTTATAQHLIPVGVAAVALCLIPTSDHVRAGARPIRATTACLSVSKATVGALRDLSFADAEIGWAVGDGRILATVDGGAHWSVQYQGPAHLALVDALDRTHAWALGGGTLLSTADGGRCWHVLAEAPPSLLQLHFIDPSRGWGIAAAPGMLVSDFAGGAPFSAGSVVRTDDGGHSWRRVASPPDPESVWFTSPRLGWLGAGGSVHHTDDGGLHWVKVLTPPAPIVDLPYLPTVRGTDPHRAWALFTAGQGAAMQSPYLGYETVDGGRHWTCVLQGPWEQACASAGGTGDYPGPFSAFDTGAAVFTGHSPARYPPTSQTLVVDSGAESRAGDVPSDRAVPGVYEISGVAFVSPAHGWVIGRWLPYGSTATVILMTTDGGAHWSSEYTATDAGVRR